MINILLCFLLFSFSGLLAMYDESDYQPIKSGHMNPELEGIDPEAKALFITWLNDIFPTHLDNLQTMPNLEKLLIQYIQEPNEEQMELIAALPHLKRLAFIDQLAWRPFEFSLAPLEYSCLEELYLSVPALPLERLAEINALPIKKLGFTFLRIYSINLEILNALDQVPSLYFLGTHFSTEHIEQLKYVSLPNLEELSIRGTVKGLRVDLLAPNLKRLFLNHTDVTGSTISYLSKMEHLEVVELADTNITSGAVRNLSKVKNLKSLNLSQNRIKEADFALLATLPQLEALNLSRSDITRSDLLALYPLKQLKTLDITALTSTTIRPEDIELLKEALPDTEVLH